MFAHGDLVVDVSKNYFTGIAKIVSLDEENRLGTVAFFRSPLRQEDSKINVPLDSLKISYLFDEQTIFCFDPGSRKWRRARYGGSRPNNEHLVIFRSGVDKDDAVVGIEDIYVLNIPDRDSLNPVEFLKARSNDTPHFDEWRYAFLNSYIKQRAACRSISSIPSSSIELEHHQLAVVRRVLQDNNKKYLLADEVGLGKTIEAGLILREQLLTQGKNCIAIVAVPDSLINQWQIELKERFYLSDLLNESLFVCSHENLASVIKIENPEILIIDEAHQLCSWTWSDDNKKKNDYEIIANGACHSDTCLLLSGTPLNGNELNFLAMLHLLAPDSYSLTEIGINNFKEKILEREKIGAIYQSLLPGTDNSTLDNNFDKLLDMLPDDSQLKTIINETKPLVDWLAPEEGEERQAKIKELRLYLGENYRLHHRMLRNRREDPSVKKLFPGLDGALVKNWEIDSSSLPIDQYLDSFKSEFLDESKNCIAITNKNFKDWIACYLENPSSLSEKAESCLRQYSDTILQFEKDALNTLIDLTEIEQRSKDKRLLESVIEYLEKREDMKIVIFCGSEKIADNVKSLIESNVDSGVERHNKRATPLFCTEKEIRILVCGPSGEDGLNLHGGEKLVIHYSLPVSFDRIEQRLGRVNRYSAHIHAKPIKSILLLPDSKSYTYYWQKILVDAVGIFNESVASLQYVLEEQISLSWEKVAINGTKELVDLYEKLSGDDGLIAKEKRHVSSQEVLNKLDLDIQLSMDFAQEIEQVDKMAESNAKDMFDWITRGLQFKIILSDQPDIFRFKYNVGRNRGGRTLLNVETLIEECLIGMDLDASDGESPLTSLMSSDRHIVSHGNQVYPFRFGQPFVDVIYNQLHEDVRGICSARLRVLNISIPSSAYFKIVWLLSKTANKSNRSEQIRGDELFRPRIVKQWINQKGELVKNDKILALLDSPYNKKEGGVYQDFNIRPEHWASLEDDYPEELWSELVDQVLLKSTNAIEIIIENENYDLSQVNHQIITSSVTFLMGSNQ